MEKDSWMKNSFKIDFARFQSLISEYDLKKPIQELDINKIFEKMALLLKTSPEVWKIILRLYYNNKEESHYYIEFKNGSYTLLEALPGKFDLEIIIDRDTWWEVVKGELSPMEAFHKRKMHVRSIGLGKPNEFFRFLINPDDTEKVLFL